MGKAHAAEGAGHSVHWDYTGEGAPANWGGLEPRFRVCELGVEQSPIDLKGATRAELGQVRPYFKPMRMRVLNNGHTVQVNAEPGSYSEIAGSRYELLQFHFHHPSEHTLNGETFPLEVHFVHRGEQGQLAVLGVFFRQGASNVELAKVFDSMPADETPERDTGVTLDPERLLPPSRVLPLHGLADDAALFAERAVDRIPRSDRSIAPAGTAVLADIPAQRPSHSAAQRAVPARKLIRSQSCPTATPSSRQAFSRA